MYAITTYHPAVDEAALQRGVAAAQATMDRALYNYGLRRASYLRSYGDVPGAQETAAAIDSATGLRMPPAPTSGSYALATDKHRVLQAGHYLRQAREWAHCAPRRAESWRVAVLDATAPVRDALRARGYSHREDAEMLDFLGAQVRQGWALDVPTEDAARIELEALVGLGVELRIEDSDLRMVFDGMAHRGQPLR